MTADAYGSILGLIQQATGNNNTSWGATFNNTMATPAERAIAGVHTITSTGGTLDLSTTVPPAGLRLDIDHIQQITGTLSSALTIVVPNVSKTWQFWNNSGGGFQTYVKVPGGAARPGPANVGGLVHIPQGCVVTVICDGAGNLIRSDDQSIGSFCVSGKAATGTGELPCNGASYLKTDFPDLYGKIGTTWGSADGLHFNVPNFMDTGRFLRSSTGSLGVGTYQSNQFGSHTHTGSVSVSGATDTQGSHTHSATPSDPGHVHTVQGGPSTGTIANFQMESDSNTTWNGMNPATTGISVSIGAAGAHAHNVSASGSFTTNATGSTETRPESAAVLICIRY